MAMLPDRLVRFVLLIIFSLKLMISARSVADTRYSQTCTAGSLQQKDARRISETAEVFQGADGSEILCGDPAREDPARDWHHFLLYGVRLKVNPQ